MRHPKPRYAAARTHPLERCTAHNQHRLCVVHPPPPQSGYTDNTCVKYNISDRKAAAAVRPFAHYLNICAAVSACSSCLMPWAGAITQPASLEDHRPLDQEAPAHSNQLRATGSVLRPLDLVAIQLPTGEVANSILHPEIRQKATGKMVLKLDLTRRQRLVWNELVWYCSFWLAVLIPGLVCSRKSNHHSLSPHVSLTTFSGGLPQNSSPGRTRLSKINCNSAFIKLALAPTHKRPTHFCFLRRKMTLVSRTATARIQKPFSHRGACLFLGGHNFLQFELKIENIGVNYLPYSRITFFYLWHLPHDASRKGWKYRSW